MTAPTGTNQTPVPDPTLPSTAAAVRDAAAGLPTAVAGFALTDEKLREVATAYNGILAALGDFDALLRDQVKGDPLAKSINELLPVAALSEGLREWFPVDPEMTVVRGTVLVPAGMTAKKADPAPEKKAEEESMVVLVKRLLGHLTE
ncbi:hypothetical protein Q9R08_10105 [Microbacterium sp. QXD-8]|uniref:DUF3806 domain-containing protein n=1 Tax=Microbacterium psychrotolerans TaxID=3068321 RepID=A0ABU0Z2W0_9MICO|nr:hypothetical protein [Microbacterium sp. QXD-8]MDQ7878325.1 hypothetical protein [Microbacterium sp. QXD-8]